MAWIEPNIIDEIFTALDRQIKVRSSKSLALVVCSGTALAALGLVSRTTKDVDVLGVVAKKTIGISIQRISKFPDWLDKAASKVARDFDLTENWLNLGPASQLESGLPDGFEQRLIRRDYGSHLTIYYISRLDQIHFKLYAAVDRGDYHVQDLLALRPKEKEIELAARWSLTQDVSKGFQSLLKDLLEKHGYGSIAEKI
jgi:hypothetical protein